MSLFEECKQISGYICEIPFIGWQNKVQKKTPSMFVFIRFMSLGLRVHFATSDASQSFIRDKLYQLICKVNMRMHWH